MKIKFLGTSAGWPLPRLGCNCEICTSKDPKDKRTRTQILINDSILLDAGPDTYNHLIKNNPANIKYLLLSHTHLDHILGLWDISHIYNKDHKINLVITQEVLNGLRKIPDLLLIQFKVTVVKPFRKIELDKNTTAEFFPVEHGRKPTFGIKIKSGKVLAYIPDLNRILPSSQKVIQDSHILIIDGSSLNKIGQVASHVSIDDGVVIAKKLQAKKTYFVHLGHKTGTHQFLENYLNQNAGPNFHIAYDDLDLQI
jgi:phosphoribosyl 1,2-cyclic phosphate phosphodiesterase